MTGQDAAEPAPIAIRLAEMGTEVLTLSTRPENKHIRQELLDALAALDRIVDLLTKPRPNGTKVRGG
jgi:hypothetical protein